MKSLSDCLAYLNQLNPAEIDLGLSRIFQVAKPLSLLTFKCPVITVAGTNGKGSVVKTLETLYTLAGYKVAAYTSPHIIHFNERIRFNNANISDEELKESLLYIEENRQSVPLSFFEFTTLAAFYYFQKMQPDVIILEVGLGGRLDAVNSVDPDISAITSIDFDHMDYLGTTLEEIGFEKAGIARAKKPLVFMGKKIPESIKKYVEEIGAYLILVDREYNYQKMGVSSQDRPLALPYGDPERRPPSPSAEQPCLNEGFWDWRSKSVEMLGLPLPFLKLRNVAGALMIIELLQKRLPVPITMVREGIGELRLEGRFERAKTLGLVFDVAHNPASAKWLAEQIKFRHPSGKKYAVFSMLRDKDIATSLEPFRDLVDVWLVPALGVSRAEMPEKIASILKTHGEKKCYTFSAVSEAVSYAMKEYDAATDLIVVFGSFHTVEQAKNYLNGGLLNGS